MEGSSEVLSIFNAPEIQNSDMLQPNSGDCRKDFESLVLVKEEFLHKRIQTKKMEP